MTINQNINLSGQVKVADTEGNNQVVAYLRPILIQQILMLHLQ